MGSDHYRRRGVRDGGCAKPVDCGADDPWVAGALVGGETEMSAGLSWQGAQGDGEPPADPIRYLAAGVLACWKADLDGFGRDVRPLTVCQK